VSSQGRKNSRMMEANIAITPHSFAGIHRKSIVKARRIA
jgi:hypothetical protein